MPYRPLFYVKASLKHATQTHETYHTKLAICCMAHETWLFPHEQLQVSCPVPGKYIARACENHTEESWTPLGEGGEGGVRRGEGSILGWGPGVLVSCKYMLWSRVLLASKYNHGFFLKNSNINTRNFFIYLVLQYRLRGTLKQNLVGLVFVSS